MTVIINHILYFFKEGFKDKGYFGLIYNLCRSEDKTCEILDLWRDS